MAPPLPVGRYTADQYVTDTGASGLTGAMNTFSGSGSGARLILAPGQTYSADFTKLNGGPSFLTIEGSAPGDGSASEGAVVEITNVNPANTSPLQYITFRRITFTAPPTSLAGTYWLNGSDNLHIMFEDCDFIDFSPSIILNSGDDIRFYGCRITQSSSPPSQMNPNILGPGGLLIIKDCLVDWNVNGAHTTSPNLNVALVGFAGYSNPSPGPWWIENNQILPSGQWSADAAIDIEPPGTTFAHCWIVRNVIRDSKICLVTGDNVWVCGNTHIIDTIYPTTAPTETSFIVGQSPATTYPPLGEIHIEDNTILDLNTSGSPNWSARKIDLLRDGYVRALYLNRNQFYYSSLPSGGSPLGVIQCVITTNNTNTTGWGILSICDNVFGCVDSSGSVLLPAIHIHGVSGSRFDRVIIRGNRGIGAGPLSGVLPATVAGGYTYLLDLGDSPLTTVVNDLTVEDNDLGASVSTSVSAWLDQHGTNTITRNQWIKNFPREPKDTVNVNANAFMYTHGATSLVSLMLPSTGPAVVILSGGTNVTSITLNGITIFSQASAPIPQPVLFTAAIGDVVVVNNTVTRPTMNVVPYTSTF